MAVTVSTSSPSNGETGVLLNPSISVTFAEALDPDYVSTKSFILADTRTSSPLETEVTITDSNTKVIISPDVNLKSYTSYRILVVGTDVSTTRAVRDSNGATLTTSEKIVFTTGNQLKTHDTSVVAKTSGDLTLEGDLYLPSNVKVLPTGLALTGYSPENYSHGQDYSYISMHFNEPISTNCTGCFDITFTPMIPGYAASTTTSGFVSSYTSPTGDFYINSNQVYWSGNSPYFNLYVEVDISDQLYSTSGNYYPGGSFAFNSEIYPEAATLHPLKREIPAVVSDVRDDYLGFLLFKNAVYAWERCGQNYSLSNPPFSAMTFTTFQTIIDVIEDKDLEKSLVAGTRRQLADLNVSIDNLVGRYAAKYESAKKRVQRAIDTLIKPSTIKLATVAVVSDNYTRLWQGATNKYRDYKMIFYQPDINVSNTFINRQAKVPPNDYFV